MQKRHSARSRSRTVIASILASGALTLLFGLKAPAAVDDGLPPVAILCGECGADAEAGVTFNYPGIGWLATGATFQPGKCTLTCTNCCVASSEGCEVSITGHFFRLNAGPFGGVVSQDLTATAGGPCGEGPFTGSATHAAGTSTITVTCFDCPD